MAGKLKGWRIAAVLTAGCGVFVGGFLIAASVKTGLPPNELVKLGVGMAQARLSRHTVADRVASILRKKPGLREVARQAGGSLRILVFKSERRVEVHAPGWEVPRVYPMTGFSGELGPKLQEGDGQIPEGIYGIDFLNPNSNFYLSLKVSYPNAADRARAKADGRTRLGGDIMIHGKNVTIGCIPIGDDAIEDVFYLVHAIGLKRVAVVIAPYDMCTGRNADLERSPLAWYPALCDEIAHALSRGISSPAN